jgi:adhesin transport system outer membrane protein
MEKRVMKKHIVALVLFTALLACTAAPAAAAGRLVTLKDTVSATINNHRRIKTMQENRGVIEHEVTRARSGWGPRLDVTSRVGVNEVSSSTTRGLGTDTGFYGTNQAGVSLVQPVWDGLATRSRVRTAEANLDSMTNRVLDNAMGLGLEAIIAHIDVLRRREIYRLSEENVRRHEQMLVSAKDRQSLGADTVADVTQTEGRLARSLSTLSENSKALRDAEETYRRLTGTPTPDNLDIVELPTRLYTSPAEVMEQIRWNNPALAAYMNDIRAMRGEQELAQSAFHPVVNLEVSPTYSDRNGPGSNWEKRLDVVLTTRWNLFASGGDVAGHEAAKGRVRMSRQALFDYMDELVKEVENSWSTYQSSKEQYHHYVTAIGYNTLTRDAYAEQFTTGQRSLLDVLDSESELFSSSTQAVTAKGNVLVSSYRMLSLGGMLLQDMDIDTSNLYDAPNEPAMPEGEHPFSFTDGLP